MPDLIKRVMPSDNWELIIELEGPQILVLKMGCIRQRFGWNFLAYLQHYRNYQFNRNEIWWNDGDKIGLELIKTLSSVITLEEAAKFTCRIGFKNQAPTKEHKTHHVYGFLLAPYSKKPFTLIQSIGGGIAGDEIWLDLTLSELLETPKWEEEMEKAGCIWAIDIIMNYRKDQGILMGKLIHKSNILMLSVSK